MSNNLSYEDWKKELVKDNILSSWETPTPDKIRIQWTIGGQSGGNCWNGAEHSYATDAEPEPEFEALDKIFEKYWSEISYIKYKRFCAKHIETSEDTDTEYYGNYTNYAVKTVQLEKLYEFLCENNRFTKIPI